MIIFTKKTKCNGRNAKHEYLFSVLMSDGIHYASFVADGSDRITREQLAECGNTLGSRFVSMGKRIPGCIPNLERLPDYGTDENKETQLSELVDFINECVKIPITYHVHEWQYMYG